MPKVRWGISAGNVDDFDRDSQYKPYDGPTPTNGVYLWKIKVLKYVAGTKDKFPQLRIGLELVPREGRKQERRYAGYFMMSFPPVSPKTAFRYVPFLDAIGVSGSDFADRTITDEDGNIKKIGKWRNDSEQLIAAELKDGVDQNNNPRKEIGWMGEPSEDYEEAEEDDEEEEYEEGEEEYDDEEEPF